MTNTAAKQNKPFLDNVASYYSARLARYGETPRGVDWNDEASQLLRFKQLSTIIQTTSHFSVNDLGCGYAALLDYLSNRYQRFSYLGIDVSEDMINAAKKRLIGRNDVRFIASTKPDKIADYTLASGIFNVRLNQSDEDWQAYILATLDILDRYSRHGFAFNCLTSYSDADKIKDYLFYANPCTLFDYCKQHYARNVALLHDYHLYEFTILVRKQG